MNPLLKMAISLIAIMTMFMANLLIIFARNKLRGVWKGTVSAGAYILLVFSLIFILMVLLTGCMYPQEERAENQIPLPDQIEAVQQSVDQYREERGVLPIATRDADTPLYEKYIIDFNVLVPQFLSHPPGNSFEEGGVFQYALVDVEENPTVKLLDLRVTQKVRDLQLRVNQHLNRGHYLPIDNIVDRKYFELDYEQLGLDHPPLVPSPFSDQHLPLVADQQGRIWVDYRMDLYQALQRDEHDLEEGEDIRYILVEHSYFVPIHSVPYTVQSNEPVFKN